MKAVVFKGIGDIALEEVQSPIIQDPKDALVRITMSTICGTDLHMIRGSMTGMQPGTILGHEGVGIVEKVGADVKKIKVGDRVIIPSTIACGTCDYCKKKIYSQCDYYTHNDSQTNTAFYGGPKKSGPFNGMQVEMVRVPFEDVGLVTIPTDVTDSQAILLSDILPTAYMGVEMADIQPTDNIAVFGCGPVGQLVILLLKRSGIKTIFAIDNVPSRLALAEKQGAHAINFDHEDPVSVLKKLTQGKGPDKIIDAVGIDAEQPHYTWADSSDHQAQWLPGNAPWQALQWEVDALCKAGTLSIIGVYPGPFHLFPIGTAMGKNLIIKMGNCNHRAYIPKLLEWVHKKEIDLTPFITQTISFDKVIDAYKHFDKREDGWLKVALLMPS